MSARQLAKWRRGAAVAGRWGAAPGHHRQAGIGGEKGCRDGRWPMGRTTDEHWPTGRRGGMRADQGCQIFEAMVPAADEIGNQPLIHRTEHCCFHRQNSHGPEITDDRTVASLA